MKNYFIKKSSLRGEITIPPSKSQTMRAIFFASLAKGTSHIKNFLKTDDSLFFIENMKKIKAKIQIKKNNLEIYGVNSKIQVHENEKINVFNSGIALRFLSSILALADKKILINGDKSIQENRLMFPLNNALISLGAEITYLQKEGFAPFEIKGPIDRSISDRHIKIDGSDSQWISALLILSSFLEGTTTLEIENPKEIPWMRLTLSWLDKFKVKYENENFKKIKVVGPNIFKGFEYEVPSDFSTILFPVAAALFTNSEIKIKDLIFDEFQNDFKTIDVFKKFGANIEINKQEKSITVKKSSLKGNGEIDLDEFVDSLPILAAFGCFNDGQIILKNAASCKKKESNRIKTISDELKKLNANVKLLDDGLLVQKSNLKAAKVNSHLDHRIALSLSCIGLALDDITTIEDIGCINKTYPTFKEDLISLGAKIL